MADKLSNSWSSFKSFSEWLNATSDGSDSTVTFTSSQPLIFCLFSWQCSTFTLKCLLVILNLEVPENCFPLDGDIRAKFGTSGSISARLWWMCIFNNGSRRKSSDCSSAKERASLYSNVAWEKSFCIAAIAASAFRAITNFLRASSPSIFVLLIRTYRLSSITIERHMYIVCKKKNSKILPSNIPLVFPPWS